MKHFTIIAMIFFALTCCAKQKVYQSNGVSYFNKPAHELDAMYKFINPTSQDYSHPYLPIQGLPLSVNEKLYFPIETSHTVNKQREAYTTIYVADAKTKAITDSLVLKEENVKQSYRHLIYNKDIYIIGTRDSTCHIYKTDSNLKVIKDYNVGIKVFYIAYASVKDGMLRIAVANPNKEIVMYDLSFETMQAERKRNLVRDYDKSCLDNDKLWFFTANDSVLSTTKIDLSVNDPSPVFKSFPIRIPMKGNYRIFNVDSIDSTLFISYSWFTDDAVGAAKLIALNYNDGRMISKEVKGLFSFDVIKIKDKTYIYRTTLVDKKAAFTVTELNPDLSEVNQKICFYLADMGNVRSIMHYKGNQFFLTGIYEQKTGKKVVEDIPGMPRLKVDELVPQPFCAILTIE